MNKRATTAQLESAKAEVGSARAAIASAHVAEQALSADRPYLFVEEAQLRAVLSGKPLPGWLVSDTDLDMPNPPRREDVPLCCFVGLKNHGKGPAIIDCIEARMETVPATKKALIDPEDMPNIPDPHTYEDYQTMHLPLIVVGPDKEHVIQSDKIWERDVTPEREAIRSGEKRLIMHGRIYYRDIVGRKWEAGFLWVFWPFGGDRDVMWTARMEPGPKAYNYDKAKT